MPASQLQLAKRAFVRVLLALAAACGAHLSVHRDSDDTALLKAYKCMIRKVHPDKGGRTKDAQKLQSAKENWEKAKRDERPVGRPKKNAQPERFSAHLGGGACPLSVVTPVQATPPSRREYRINSSAVMLTYNGIRDLSHWYTFLAFVRSGLPALKVKHWCATLERTKTDKVRVKGAAMYG